MGLEYCVQRSQRRRSDETSLDTSPVPRSRIAHLAVATSFLTGASTSQLGWQVCGVDVFRELRFVAFTENVDLADGSFVEPSFDEGPDG